MAVEHMKGTLICETISGEAVVILKFIPKDHPSVVLFLNDEANFRINKSTILNINDVFMDVKISDV